MTLSETLRSLREQAGLKPEQAASVADVHWATYYRWEAGTTRPPWNRVALLLDAYGTSRREVDRVADLYLGRAS